MGHHHHSPSRRAFLRAAGSTTIGGLAAAPFLDALAATDTTGAYKALVCVFLSGGNDGYNTVLATDDASWTAYQATRGTGTSPIALALPGTPRVASAAPCTPAALGGSLAIAPTAPQSGRSFALHPLLKNTQRLFGSGRVGIVANVGTLMQPTTAAQYAAGSIALPPKLYSHNDQQSVWQSSAVEGGAQSGWGGRLAEYFASANAAGSGFSAVSPSGQAVWLNGRSLVPYQVGLDGAVQIGSSDYPLYNSMASWNILRSVVGGARMQMLEKDHAAVAQRSMERSVQLRSALPAVGAGGVLAATPYSDPYHGVDRSNPLAQQLQVVARMIAARDKLGMKRQVFFVTLPGFDTHANQNVAHADLMARLDHALGYFNDALTNLPGGDASALVTTFTASDFGRSLVSNGDGTDHGWGGHHFVMGGAVRGGNIYGRFPEVGLRTADDVGNGRLLPALGVGQYGATLASWFGASSSQLDELFPTLRNFGSQRSIGFMA